MTSIILQRRSIFVPEERISAPKIQWYLTEYLKDDFKMMVIFKKYDEYELIIWVADKVLDMTDQIRDMLLNRINTGRLTPSPRMIDASNEVRVQMAPSISIDQLMQYCEQTIGKPIDLVHEEIDSILWTIIKFDRDVNNDQRSAIHELSSAESQLIVTIGKISHIDINEKIYKLFVKYLPNNLPGEGCLNDEFGPDNFTILKLQLGVIISWTGVIISQYHCDIITRSLHEELRISY